MKFDDGKVLVVLDQEVTCGSCGSDQVETGPTIERFSYGVPPNQVSLRVTVDVRTCKACGFQFTDHTGEDAREKAVADYLDARSNKTTP